MNKEADLTALMDDILDLFEKHQETVHVEQICFSLITGAVVHFEHLYNCDLEEFFREFVKDLRNTVKETKKIN